MDAAGCRQRQSAASRALGEANDVCLCLLRTSPRPPPLMIIRSPSETPAHLPGVAAATSGHLGGSSSPPKQRAPNPSNPRLVETVQDGAVSRPPRSPYLVEARQGDSLRYRFGWSTQCTCSAGLTQADLAQNMLSNLSQPGLTRCQCAVMVPSILAGCVQQTKPPTKVIGAMRSPLWSQLVAKPVATGSCRDMGCLRDTCVVGPGGALVQKFGFVVPPKCFYRDPATQMISLVPLHAQTIVARF